MKPQLTRQGERAIMSCGYVTLRDFSLVLPEYRLRTAADGRESGH